MAHRYLLFHKPFNVLCQFTPGTGSETRQRKTLADFIPIGGVYPVGRLDQDSEGLLLLTDDGALQHRLSEPKFEHPRTYWAQVEGIVTENAAAQLRAGVKIADYVTKAAKIRLIDPPPVAPRDPPIRFRATIPTSWLELQLTEGRNRQVRKMTSAVGFPTLRLIRIAIDFLQLGQLKQGEYRDLSGDELTCLPKVKTARVPPSPLLKKRRP